MLLNRNNLAVGIVAASEKSEEATRRPMLAGVLVTKRGTAATDSYRLVRVAAPDVDENDFPVIPGMPPVTGDLPDTILPGSVLKPARDALKRAEKHRAMPILAHVQLVKGARDTIQLGTTDLETPSVIGVQELIATYPDVDRPLPSEPPAFSVSWHCDTVRKLAKLLDALDLDHDYVHLHFWANERAPAYITTRTAQGQLVEYIAMPSSPCARDEWVTPRPWSRDEQPHGTQKAEDFAATAAAFETPPDWTTEQPAEAPAVEVAA